MLEPRTVAWIRALLTTGIGIAAFFLVSARISGTGDEDLKTDRYEAILLENGTLIATSLYDAGISGKHRIPCRTWDNPVAIQPIAGPYIRFPNVTARRDQRVT